MDIYFTGKGQQVFADFKGFTIQTDQSAAAGGTGIAPNPFQLFLVSIGTCAGYYVLQFCQERGIDVSDIRLHADFERDSITNLTTKISISIQLPSSFPAKYKTALERAANQCTVKKHLVHPPEILIQAKLAE